MYCKLRLRSPRYRPTQVAKKIGNPFALEISGRAPHFVALATKKSFFKIQSERQVPFHDAAERTSYNMTVVVASL